jgi:hypothetical protein
VQYLRDFVQCVPNARTGVGFDCLFLFKLGRYYVIHMLTICMLLFGSECAGYMFISCVAWRRAIRAEGCATALFTSDLIELWEIMWDLIKNKDSLNIAPMSFSTFRFVWML